MAKLSALVMEVVIALIFTIVGYTIADYMLTSIGTAMSITFPSYFTSLGLTIVFIMIFFGLVIYVLTHAMHTGGKKD